MRIETRASGLVRPSSPVFEVVKFLCCLVEEEPKLSDERARQAVPRLVAKLIPTADEETKKRLIRYLSNCLSEDQKNRPLAIEFFFTVRLQPLLFSSRPYFRLCSDI
jgi:hypothetical protein